MAKFTVITDDRLRKFIASHPAMKASMIVEIYLGPSTVNVPARMGYAKVGRPAKGSSPSPQGGGAVSRPARENWRIAHFQAKQGRAPWELRASQRKAIVKMLQSAIKDVEREHSTRALRPSAARLGNMISAAIRQRIDAGDGMRPVNERYAVWKRRRYGESRVLVRTGLLYKSISHRERVT